MAIFQRYVIFPYDTKFSFSLTRFQFSTQTSVSDIELPLSQHLFDGNRKARVPRDFRKQMNLRRDILQQFPFMAHQEKINIATCCINGFQEAKQNPLRPAQLHRMGKNQNPFFRFRHLKQSTPKILCKGLVSLLRRIDFLLKALFEYQWILTVLSVIVKRPVGSS